MEQSAGSRQLLHNFRTSFASFGFIDNLRYGCKTRQITWLFYHHPDTGERVTGKRKDSYNRVLIERCAQTWLPTLCGIREIFVLAGDFCAMEPAG